MPPSSVNSQEISLPALDQPILDLIVFNSTQYVPVTFYLQHAC